MKEEERNLIYKRDLLFPGTCRDIKEFDRTQDFDSFSKGLSTKYKVSYKA